MLLSGRFSPVLSLLDSPFVLTCLYFIVHLHHGQLVPVFPVPNVVSHYISAINNLCTGMVTCYTADFFFFLITFPHVQFLPKCLNIQEMGLELS